MKNIHKLYEKHLAELGVKTPTHNIIQYNNIVQDLLRELLWKLSFFTDSTLF